MDYLGANRLLDEDEIELTDRSAMNAERGPP